MDINIDENLAQTGVPLAAPMAASLGAVEKIANPAEAEKTGSQAENQALTPVKLTEIQRKELEKELELLSATSDGRPSPLEWTPRSPLDQLPNRDQHWLKDLLDDHPYKTVKMIIAQPRPAGLGVRTSITSLHRFYYRFRSEDIDEHHDILRQQVDHILAYVEDDDKKFSDASKHLLKRRLLETTLSPHSTTEEIAAIHAILDRIKSAELAERRLQLAEQKAEAQVSQSAARETLEPPLNQVNATSNVTPT